MERLATRQFGPLSTAELGVYRTYERERHQRMLQVMLPLAAGLFWVTSVVLTVRIFLVNALMTYWMLYVGFLAMTLGFTLGVVAIRRGQVTAAAMAMILTGGLGLLFLIGYQVFLLPVERLDPYTLSEFLFFGCVIALVGVLGNLWTVIGATLLVNALTVLMVYLGPRSHELTLVPKMEFDSITVAALLLEWLIAAFLIANWSTHRRQALRSLGTAYARIYQAEQLDALKDQFIMHVNHELRTPITALYGYVEYLREAHPQLSQEKLADALERASRAGTELVALLSSTLEVGRLEGATETFVPTAVSVRETLDTALSLLGPSEASRLGQDVQVTVPAGVAILGEPIRLRRILANLLSNALKYSPPGTPIKVTARVLVLSPTGTRRREDKNRTYIVEIRAHDSGLGIPPEQAPLLFNRFVRLPRDLASSVAGSGLGLYLCRVMTESMGGTIRVESSGVEGEGSTFIVRLPMAQMQNANGAVR